MVKIPSMFPMEQQCLTSSEDLGEEEVVVAPSVSLAPKQSTWQGRQLEYGISRTKLPCTEIEHSLVSSLMTVYTKDVSTQAFVCKKPRPRAGQL